MKRSILVMTTLTGLLLFACDAGKKFEPEDGDETDQDDVSGDQQIDTDADQDGDVTGDVPVEGDVLPDGPVDVPDEDVPADGVDVPDGDVIGECSDAGDCETIYGPAPCGAWECNGGLCDVNCPGCTDADRDGYGTGTCAGPDCDDADDAVFDSATRVCYSGASGTEGVGTCLAGTETCTAGVWGPCVGEVVPSGEACNLEDDDCDGPVDEDLGDITCGIGACVATAAACTGGNPGVCTPLTPPSLNDPCDGIDNDCDGAVDENCATCVPVSPMGDDSTADGTTSNPFRTIQAAIDWAAADTTRPRIVCVASGNVCNRTALYDGAVTMSDGISVYGKYEYGGWTRCTNSTTVIRPGTDRGVVFPNSISQVTVLDGFRIDRHNSSTTSAVTVDGAVNVILSDLLINNTPSVTNSYGINMINGAEVLVTLCDIQAGSGSVESMGIRSVGSTPTIRSNCRRYDSSGRCDEYCSASGDAIRGRFTNGTGLTYAVYLEDSPDAVVESNAMCGNDADRGAVVGIRGDGSGIVIRGNLINAWGGIVDSHGVWMEDCDAAAPWVVNNFLIAAAGDSNTTRVDGVRAIGDCHPVIDSNVRITGGSEGGTSGANGVYCGASTSGTASQCVVLGNALIQGSEWGYPPTSVGVRCDDDGCMRIAGNVITGRAGVDVWGLWLGESGTFVDNNAITGGCGTNTATAVYAENSFARLQNNLIMAGNCNTGISASPVFYGLHAMVSDGGYEIDVHSNDIDGGGMAAPCTSSGVEIDVTGTAPTGGVGIFRNNIIMGGLCNTAYVVAEAAAGADPRIFENNNLDPRDTPTALYLDEGSSPLTTDTAVNALTDMTVGGVRSADSMFVSYPADLHISSGSPCDGAGTPDGAPLFDMDGESRDTTSPDIGADEI